MVTATFNTLEFAEELKASGIPDEQAKAQARALSKALESKDLATKSDLKELELAFKGDLEKINGELKLIKWMLALVIVVTVIPALKTLFLH